MTVVKYFSELSHANELVQNLKSFLTSLLLTLEAIKASRLCETSEHRLGECERGCERMGDVRSDVLHFALTQFWGTI